MKIRARWMGLLAGCAVALAMVGTERAALAGASVNSAFTYQGELLQNGTPVTGATDFRFSLFNDPSGGSQIGSTLESLNVNVQNGLFVAELNFGAVFSGEQRWLQIEVRRPAGSGSYVPLSPRQQLTAAPYSSYSLAAPPTGAAGGVLSGTYPNPDIQGPIPFGIISGAPTSLPPSGAAGGVLGGNYPNPTFAPGATLPPSGPAGGDLSGTYPNPAIGSGVVNSTRLATDEAALAKVSGNAMSASSGDVGVGVAPGGAKLKVAGVVHSTTGGFMFPDGTVQITAGGGGGGGGGWGLTGNSLAGTEFLGSTNSQAVNFRANNARAFRLEPGSSPNVVGGHASNSVTNGVVGATVAGGGSGASPNMVGANFGTVAGGEGNTASGLYAFAAGRNAQATHNGAFVWGDSSAATVGSIADDSFVVRASGGYRLYSNSALSSGVRLNAGSGTWTSLSDRNVKENIRPVDSKQILERVAALEISEWNYKTQDPSMRHIGPMAQDFREAFGVGEDETSITVVDADGVALAAIKGLHEIVREKDAKIAELEARLRAIEAAIQAAKEGSR